MSYFLIALLFLSLMYAAFMAWCVYGWKKLKLFHPSPGKLKTRVAVIIPARNEEKNIGNCLHDILNQNYPKEFLEIIVVNDHSTDRTAEIVPSIVKKNPEYKISFLENGPGGSKKQAITTAVHATESELIVTTDADCRMPENWLASIVSYYETEHPDMIAAPVCFHQEKNNFEKLQRLEFSGLIGIGAGAISNHHPLMCNGANLSYTKKIFHEVNGFTGQEGTASGDDTQLMLKIAKKDFSKIHFLKSRDAVVYTHAAGSVKELFHQRKRWASKIPGKMNSFALFIASVVYAVHLGLFMSLVALFFHPAIIPVFLFSFLLKVFSEYTLLRHMNRFFRKENLLWLFLPAQILYMVYISFIGAASLFGSYRWKGRDIRSAAVKLSA